ncbi:MAG: septum formation initiator family protein [Salinibacter sp.]
MLCSCISAVFNMDEPTHPELPNSNPAPPVPDSIQPGDSDEGEELTHLPPEYRAVVRRLRAQVARATTALDRLQAENERLRRRVEELEQRPALQEDTTAFVLDDDPEALRARISHFIEAIDTFLDDETTVPNDSAPADPSP